MGFVGFTRFGLTSTFASLKGLGSSFSPKRTDESLFTSKLEGRLDNLSKGRETGSDLAVDIEISSRDAAVNQSLASQDPKALQSYTALLSGLSYSRSARIITNVDYTVRSLSTIPSEEEAQAQTDKVVAAYRDGAAQAKKRKELALQVEARTLPKSVTPPPASGSFSTAENTRAIGSYQNAQGAVSRVTGQKSDQKE
jgi:hypothetical protein